MKKGLILINAYSDAASALNQSKRLREEFLKLGVEITVKRNDGFTAFVDGGKTAVRLEENYDFCIYLDKDKYVSQLLEKSGLRLFNSHAAIQACDDKMLTHVLLADCGIPMPKTIPGLLCYDERAEISDGTFEILEERLGYPIIVKECYGSLGKGVYKAENRDELKDVANKLKCKSHLFQECVNTSLGKDIRVIVIGGKVIAAMMRSSQTDFRSNLELGGKGEKTEIPEKLKALCIRTAEILGLDYCGIDVLFAGDGNYCICEVNSNAFFGGIEKVTGVNVAEAYARYICGKIYG